MLRVAVPNKGSLSAPATELLGEAGYRVHREHRALLATDRDNQVQLVFLRPGDIARTVGSGVLDLGITGQDLLREVGTAASTTELLELGFGRSEFYFAARPGLDDVTKLDGCRIATSFPGLVRQGAAEHGIAVQVVELDGAVETAVELGLADAIADVVETGSSLRAAGLETLGEPVLRSQAALVRGNEPLSEERERAADVLVQRLLGVVRARQWVLVDYNCPTELLDRARTITPGVESPTVSPLNEDGWVSVRAMVQRSQAQSVMDQLWQVGARAILVVPLDACRL
jgi:ATP phosphoribosyltransferase